MKRSHAKLIFDRGGEAAVQVHNLVLVSEFLGQLEEKSILERGVHLTLFALLLGFLILSEGVETGGLEQVDLLVVTITLHQLIVHIHGTS